MWRKFTVILMSMSVLVCTVLVKNVNAATNFFGSSTFTPLFLDEGFLGRSVNLDLPEIDLNVSFGESDIPYAGVLTIITEIPKASSAMGNRIINDSVQIHWQTNAPESPATAMLTLYTSACSAESEFVCNFEQNYQGRLTLINPTTSDEKTVSALVKINSTVTLVLVPRPKPEDPGYMTEGSASWYAYKGCDCAASPDFPKGSYVKVTRLNDPSKSVIVRINDYGPERDIFPDRVIDLDKVAFQKIAPLGAGLTNVRVEPCDAPSTPPAPPVQVAPTPAPQAVAELAWEY